MKIICMTFEYINKKPSPSNTSRYKDCKNVSKYIIVGSEAYADNLTV